jgi:hypothetical protein
MQALEFNPTIPLYIHPINKLPPHVVTRIFKSAIQGETAASSTSIFFNFALVNKGLNRHIERETFSILNTNYPIKDLYQIHGMGTLFISVVLKKFPNLTCVNLSNLDFLETTILKRVSKDLTELNLDHCNLISVWDEESDPCFNGFKYIRRCTDLTSLSLKGGDRITDNELEELKNFSKLTSLSLADCRRITYFGLSNLQKLSQLKSLDLQGCKEGAFSMWHLKNPTHLTSLNLKNAGVTDKNIGLLMPFDKLKSLNLANNDPITNISMTRLALLPSLTHLDVTNCRNII